jgi:hypothetical protein
VKSSRSEVGVVGSTYEDPVMYTNRPCIKPHADQSSAIWKTGETASTQVKVASRYHTRDGGGFRSLNLIRDRSLSSFTRSLVGHRKNIRGSL